MTQYSAVTSSILIYYTQDKVWAIYLSTEHINSPRNLGEVRRIRERYFWPI